MRSWTEGESIEKAFNGFVHAIDIDSDGVARIEIDHPHTHDSLLEVGTNDHLASIGTFCQFSEFCLWNLIQLTRIPLKIPRRLTEFEPVTKSCHNDLCSQ
jgi:hypothetical protein